MIRAVVADKPEYPDELDHAKVLEFSSVGSFG